MSNIEDDVCRAIEIHDKIALFVMNPLTREDPNSDLAIIQLLTNMPRVSMTLLRMPKFCYAENLDNLALRLLNRGEQPTLGSFAESGIRRNTGVPFAPSYCPT